MSKYKFRIQFNKLTLFGSRACIPFLKTIFLFLIFNPQIAVASMAPQMYPVLLQLSGSIAEGTTTANGNISSQKIGLDVLYFKRDQIAFGGRYLIESRNETLETSSGEAYGPSLGYFSVSGAYVLLSYDLVARLGSWSNGRSIQLDLGYMEHLRSQLHLGGKISVRQAQYKTDSNNPSASEKNVQDTFLSGVVTYLF